MTQTVFSRAPHSAAEILRRIALPLLLFSVVLASLLTLSWRLLLPKLTAFAAGDRAVSAKELPSYEQSLRSRIATALARREELVLPSGLPAYEALQAERAAAWPIDAFERELRSLARAASEEDAIIFDAVWIDEATGEAGVRGDVRNVGFSSLTVLARFIEKVSAAEWAESVTPSPFDRMKDEAGNMHSPFTLTIRLRPLSAR